MNTYRISVASVGLFLLCTICIPSLADGDVDERIPIGFHNGLSRSVTLIQVKESDSETWSSNLVTSFRGEPLPVGQRIEYIPLPHGGDWDIKVITSGGEEYIKRTIYVRANDNDFILRMIPLTPEFLGIENETGIPSAVMCTMDRHIQMTSSSIIVTPSYEYYVAPDHDMTYYEAMDWASNLVVNGRNDWQLPSSSNHIVETLVVEGHFYHGINTSGRCFWLDHRTDLENPPPTIVRYPMIDVLTISNCSVRSYDAEHKEGMRAIAVRECN